jgi:hypothetical protein
MNVKYYIVYLIKQGHIWQHTDINGITKTPKLVLSGLQWLILLFSISLLYILPKGFNKEFVGYIITALSLFVGLFLTLILSFYQKFQGFDFSNTQELPLNEKIVLKQTRNYFIQFTSLTSYSILISLFCICLLSLNLLFESLNIDILQYQFIKGLKDLNINTVFRGLGISVICIYRLIVIYFIFDFFYLTTYALGSIFKFLMVEYQKKKVEND